VIDRPVPTSGGTTLEMRLTLYLRRLDESRHEIQRYNDHVASTQNWVVAATFVYFAALATQPSIGFWLFGPPVVLVLFAFAVAVYERMGVESKLDDIKHYELLIETAVLTGSAPDTPTTADEPPSGRSWREKIGRYFCRSVSRPRVWGWSVGFLAVVIAACLMIGSRNNCHNTYTWPGW
jgi:hypothetical protein